MAKQKIGICDEEMFASIPALQEELVESVKLRGIAFQSYYSLKSEYDRLKLKFEVADKELEQAKAKEQSVIHRLTDAISVQNSPRADKLRAEGKL